MSDDTAARPACAQKESQPNLLSARYVRVRTCFARGRSTSGGACCCASSGAHVSGSYDGCCGGGRGGGGGCSARQPAWPSHSCRRRSGDGGDRPPTDGGAAATLACAHGGCADAGSLTGVTMRLLWGWQQQLTAHARLHRYTKPAARTGI
eukprot:126248-Chlamydomonas_euryale.AAC.8